ncbi:MAG: glycosyltransferase [Chloroflexi bacterium]|nr:glycosyltransferase [Chloroflexota bacterium]
MQHTTLCSVCIATYHRPHLLARLLDSLLQQQLDPGTTLEIIVVDNDAQQSAKAVVEGIDQPRFPIVYAVEPRKNISHARNKCVQLARGEYILFIDDDETAGKTWVASMLDAVKTHEADGVFGRVISDFHDETPEWMKSVYLFNIPTLQTGSPARYFTVGNCLVKASLLKTEDGPFDKAYGIMGGEDMHLFSRLRQQGKHFIYCYEGWVAEFVPPERTRVDWILKRAYRTGNLFGRRSIELADNRLMMRGKILATGVVKMFGCLLLTALHLPNKEKRWHWFFKTAANSGLAVSVFNVKIAGY